MIETYENPFSKVTPIGDILRGYRIHLLIIKDEDGMYSAVAMNLPGAGSCGNTEDEAIANARDGIRGVLESYKDSSENIPWSDTTSAEIPNGAKQMLIIVDA